MSSVMSYSVKGAVCSQFFPLSLLLPVLAGVRGGPLPPHDGWGAMGLSLTSDRGEEVTVCPFPVRGGLPRRRMSPLPRAFSIHPGEPWAWSGPCSQNERHKQPTKPPES